MSNAQSSVNQSPRLAFAVERITPEIANKYLKTSPGNRNISRHRVEALVSTIKAGNWQLNHQGIAFNDKGELRDGHHRLMAIAASGCAVDMMVTRGTTNQALLYVDTNRPRSFADNSAMSDDSVLKHLNKDCVAVSRILVSCFCVGSVTLQLRQDYIQSVFSAHAEEIIFSVSVLPLGHTKPFASAPIRAAFAAAAQYESEEKLKNFADTLRLGLANGMPSNSTPLILRDFFLRSVQRMGLGRVQRIQTLLQTMYMIKAFCAGREAKRVPKCIKEDNGVFIGYEKPAYDMEMPKL